MKRYLLSFTCLFLLTSCAPALPSNEASEEIKLAAERATKAAEQTASSHAKIEAQMAKTEALLKEAREALARANQANALCSQINTRFPKELKPRIVYIKPKPATEAQSASSSAASATPPPASEFSPSDAPGGKYSRKSGETVSPKGVSAVPSPSSPPEHTGSSAESQHHDH